MFEGFGEVGDAYDKEDEGVEKGVDDDGDGDGDDDDDDDE